MTDYRTLYESLKGKPYEKGEEETILSSAKNIDLQKAIFGLIIHHASLEGLEPKEDDLPYGITQTTSGFPKISGKKLPEELLRKINQLVSK